MKIYEGAIFDLDGTLLDSMNVWRKIDVDFLGKRGFQVPGIIWRRLPLWEPWQRQIIPSAGLDYRKTGRDY